MRLRSLLLPLTPLYRIGLASRERRFAKASGSTRQLRFPVISIGNLSTGGSGKTPLTIALANALAARGFGVDVLSRGYGRRGRGAARVCVGGAAAEFGDEPLLIAREAAIPVYVAPQRFDAGLLAEAEMGPDAQAVHILDDGFQHRQLHRDFDILLLNGNDWRDRVLPAGNLREPLTAAMRADVIAIPEAEPELEADLRRWGWSGPLWRLRRHMQIPPVEGPVLAFCGIARPGQFFTGLESAGVRIAARRAFRDHHRYIPGEIRRLAEKARAAGANALLTTAKDAVRVAGIESEMPILQVDLRTEIQDESAAIDWLISRVAQARGREMRQSS